MGSAKDALNSLLGRSPLMSWDDKSGIPPLGPSVFYPTKTPTAAEIEAMRQQQQLSLMANVPEAFDSNALAQQIWAQAQQAPPPTTKSNPPLHVRAKELFLKRVGGIRAEMTLKPDDFLQMHVYQDTVFVFFLFNGKEGVVSEPVDLFPSDQLITQFRLLLS
jgi:hypothetical protein